MKKTLDILLILVLFTSTWCLHQATEDIKQLTSENAVLQEQLAANDLPLECLGTFTVSYYCTENYKHICNDGDLHTATGGLVQANHSVAVDPTVIPLGSFIFVNGHIYVADDTGGVIKGNHIDIAVPTHKEALDLGVQEVTVFIFKED